MRKSDIFDDFAKIALEKGIIVEASPEELKKKLEENPRMDSLDISAIEALYGVKPDAPKDMQYKKNIFETAHPKSVVVAPSHDKLNGLVENPNEAQNIALHIVNKTNDGHLTGHKYAEQNLVLTLVRLGNSLDNSKKDELRILADTCLQQTTEDIKKKDLNKFAVGDPVTLGIGATVALIAVPLALTLGGIYLHQHLSYVNDGFVKNHEKLISEIDDLIKDSVSWGLGYKYKQELLDIVTDFRDKITDFYNVYMQIKPVIDYLEKPKTAKELVALVKSTDTEAIRKAHDIILRYANDMLPYINSVESQFKKETFKATQTEDKGWMQKVIDWTRFLHGGAGLIADDFDDVVRAIPPYKKSIGDILEVFKNAKTFRDNAKIQLEEAVKESKSEFSTPSAKEPDLPTKSPAKPSVETKSTEEHAEDLEKDLRYLGKELKLPEF